MPQRTLMVAKDNGKTRSLTITASSSTMAPTSA
jgi:hypothetical protein